MCTKNHINIPKLSEAKAKLLSKKIHAILWKACKMSNLQVSDDVLNKEF